MAIPICSARRVGGEAPLDNKITVSMRDLGRDQHVGTDILPDVELLVFSDLAKAFLSVLLAAVLLLTARRFGR